MNFNDLYKTLENNKYYLFTFRDVLLFYPNEKKNSLKRMLYRWKNRGWVCALKKGLYELSYPRELIIPDMYVANKLYSPSYVSLETALSHYSIIPEVAMAVTSITTRPTRRFKNKHGLFIYHTVKTDVFTGYYIDKQEDFDIFIAEPEKALVDYLYFKSYHNRKFTLKGERLDRDIISHLNTKKINRYAKVYNLKLKGILYAYL